MKFFYISKAFIILAFLQFNISLSINLSVIKNFYTEHPNFMDFNFIRNYDYNSLVRSYEFAHKHQAVIFGAIGLVTLGLAAYLHINNESDYEKFIKNEGLDSTKYYYTSLTHYFILSEQGNEDHPYGISLFDTKEGFLEKIVIKNHNKEILERHITDYINYRNLNSKKSYLRSLYSFFSK